MADGFRLHLSNCLQKLPSASLVLLILVAIKVAKGLHVYHPEIIEETFANVMTSKYVQLVLVSESGMVSTPFWYF